MRPGLLLVLWLVRSAYCMDWGRLPVLLLLPLLLLPTGQLAPLAQAAANLLGVWQDREHPRHPLLAPAPALKRCNPRAPPRAAPVATDVSSSPCRPVRLQSQPARAPSVAPEETLLVARHAGAGY